MDPVDPDPDSDPEHCLLVTTMSPTSPLPQLELATCPTCSLVVTGGTDDVTQGGGVLPGLRLHRGPAAHADAGGGVLRRPGEDHAGLPHAGDVQAKHGRARPLHVSGRRGQALKLKGLSLEDSIKKTCGML